MMVAGYGWSQSKNYLLSFNLCVDFFFILSGFVIETSYGGRMRGVGDYARFLRARFARIYPLHLLTVLACIPMCVAAADSVHFRAVARFLDLAFVPANLLMLQAFNVTGGGSLNVAAWSISAEMAMYLTFPLSLMLLRVFRPLGAMAIALIIFLLVANLRAQPWTLATNDFGVLRAAPGFLIGASISTLLRKYRAPAVSTRHISLVVGALGLTMVCAVDANVIALLLPLAVAIPALAELNGRAGFFGSRLMGVLGDASYSIYMLHLPILYVLCDQLDRADLMAETKSALVFTLAPIVTLALALPMYRWFERPMRSLLSGVKASRSRPLVGTVSVLEQANP